MRRLTALRQRIRLPLRVRLTLAFAAATAVLLAAAGTLVFLQVKAGLDGSLDASLRARAAQFARLAEGPSDAPLRRAFAVEGERQAHPQRKPDPLAQRAQASHSRYPTPRTVSIE